MSSPSVFNFFRPGYSPAGPVSESGMVAPEFQILNAISAISVVGAIITAGSDSTTSRILGFLAVTSAMINVVGGFMITDRMLRMFKDKIGSGQAGSKQADNKQDGR
jgi:NAD/NADP transhydrogenase alpha subunit